MCIRDRPITVPSQFRSRPILNDVAHFIIRQYRRRVVKRSAWFDSELIIRKMGWSQSHRIGNIGQGLVYRLSWQAEHQVQIEVLQPSGMSGFGGGERGAAVVNPSQLLQLSVVEALHSDGQPVDTDGTKFSEPVLFHRARIGFQGDFQIRAQRQAGTQARQQPIQRLGGEQAGGTTANEQAANPPPPYSCLLYTSRCV